MGKMLNPLRKNITFSEGSITCCCTGVSCCSYDLFFFLYIFYFLFHLMCGRVELEVDMLSDDICFVNLMISYNFLSFFASLLLN